MLRQIDLTGRVIDKVKMAIERLIAFEPEEGYYLAFSGGKDSVVIKALADMAGGKYDAHYSATTVDPPELVRFIKSQHKEVAFELPKKTMRQLIIAKQAPPTRIQRYCCQYLKETNGVGRVTLTGVRWAESKGRRDNQGMVTILSGQRTKETLAIAEEQGANFTNTVRGGVILNLDNAAERRTVELCYRTKKTLVNPIIDWTDDDVWEFIKAEGIPYCHLYDEGCKRLGCVGCPLGGAASMIWETEVKWPQFRGFYVKTFDEMIAARIRDGKQYKTPAWMNGENLFMWWTGRFQNPIQGQLTMFDEEYEDETID
jgi:phosphoadenosine phosphosulfate reductase